MDYSSNINADVPIKTIDDDELNRADFSIRVAESILNYDNEECLVLGLMGEGDLEKHQLETWYLNTLNLIMLNIY